MLLKVLLNTVCYFHNNHNKNAEFIILSLIGKFYFTFAPAERAKAKEQFPWS